MARKPKGWVKREREWLNTPTAGCMAGVSWRVQLDYDENWNLMHNLTASGLKATEARKKAGYKAFVSAQIEINEEGRSHYVSRKADLRAIRRMRKNLDAFEDACQKAFDEAEEFNAQS